eukprot:COSAG03_NODE_9806_length_692_cov_1.315346_1_plen_79_part_00
MSCTGSAEAQRRFKDAFDGSDLSTYDSHRRSQKKLTFGAEVSDKSLKAIIARRRLTLEYSQQVYNCTHASSRGRYIRP